MNEENKTIHTSPSSLSMKFFFKNKNNNVSVLYINIRTPHVAAETTLTCQNYSANVSTKLFFSTIMSSSINHYT
jgi:hypothetical protein